MTQTLKLFDAKQGNLLVTIRLDDAGKCLDRVKVPDAARWGSLHDAGRLIGEGRVSVREAAAQATEAIGQFATALAHAFDGAEQNTPRPAPRELGDG